MAEVKGAIRDKYTGYVSPPVYPCYQDVSKLCNLRAYPDSNMQCVFEPKTCSHAMPRCGDNAK